MKCPKCGGENSDTAKFCKTCGESLNAPVRVKENKSNNTLIIAVIAIIVISMVGVGVYATGILNPGPSLENKDFEFFKMDVPVGSDFQLSDGAAKDDNHIAVLYENTGKYANETNIIAFGKGISDVTEGYTPDEVDNDMEIYKGKDGKHDYGVFYKKDGFEVFIIGDDLNTMKKMAESLRIGDVSDFKYSPTTTHLQSSAPKTTAPSTSKMTILGGSISTGSGLDDKTTASIYVGSEYSGANVKIQVYYSRDGSSLNPGNIVAKTVDSSGYITVNSANAFKYYPDLAEINLYDSSGNLLDTKTVSLDTASGSQTF